MTDMLSSLYIHIHIYIYIYEFPYIYEYINNEEIYIYIYTYIYIFMNFHSFSGIKDIYISASYVNCEQSLTQGIW